ncbi:MAG TPA: DNA polymerase III subunit gamma/tau [Anaerohalosphaeraceae bacterium]|nr:DNA polymerase III subunit gamma/tau [Anaerohalosphaeraceae bacterium]HQG06699.1 DNA polymerase III subunit gamma/tau [Anaerohalosphaeraceae bacterium]HQI08230.1 DNA polymerase III subunit gamma/tau [Anaerohalosphaeraceae bacterium]
MTYTVLARRYRSQTFDDVVGQDAVAQTLKNAILSGRVAHAYLFTGTRGVGKTTMARILAKSLNCLQAKEPTIHPCLACDSCKAIHAGEDIDVIEIDGASNNKVEHVRELIANAIYLPARARFKIYIIDEVHMLTTNAFNALLKILEEPPPHVKFIFATTEPNKVLPTIQSRCQRFDFAAMTPQTIVAQLRKILQHEQVDYEEDLLIHLARLAGGSMRDALSLLDQLLSVGSRPLTVSLLMECMGRPDRRHLLQLARQIASHSGPGVLEETARLIESGQPPAAVCDSLMELFRDLMVLKAAGTDSPVLILTEAEKNSLKELADFFDIPGLIYAVSALERLRWMIRNSETGRYLLEAALLRLALSEHFIGLDQLAKAVPPSPEGIKKNASVPNSSPSSAAVSPAEPAESVPSPDVPLTEDTLRARWGQFLAYLGQRSGTPANYLSQAVLAGFADSVLHLRFASGALFAAEFCRKHQKEIESSLSQFFGRKLSFRFELSAESPQNGAVKTPAAAPPQNRRHRAEVLDDPKVQLILKELNATPTEIVEISPDEQGAEEQAESDE